MLRYPDFARTFYVKPDWSAVGIGAVLTQFDDQEREHPVVYLSRRCRGKESTYCSRRGELVALWYAVSKWRPFLEGQQFVVLSDDLSLTTMAKRSEDLKIQRYLNELQAFKCTVKHKRGKDHIDADALSRCHEPSAADESDIVDDSTYAHEHILAVQPISTNSRPLPGHVDAVSQMALAQAADPVCIRIREKIDQNPSSKDKYLMSNNGLIYRRQTAPRNHQLLIPRSERRRYFDMHHSSPAAAHFGRDRTLDRLTSTCYWPGLHKEVTQWVRDCECQRSKLTRPKSSGFMFVRPRRDLRPWTRVHIDHYGPLNRTGSPDNYTYILTVSCADSHSCHFIPIRNNGASETARALLMVFEFESFPESVISDRHQAFRSQLIKALCDLAGIHLFTTVAYRAQGNSPAERPHRFLNSCLKTMVNEDMNNWHRFLSLILLAYRSCVHPALGETPFFLERGRDPIAPAEIQPMPNSTGVKNKSA